MSHYQLLPDLAPEVYAALRDDIKSAGVRVPIDVDENGDILDGHHRKQIADELGIECPERVIRDLPEFAKVDYALTVNLTRRHLDNAGKKTVVTKSLKRDPRLSDREHARRCGVSHTFVSGLREALEAAEQLATAASRVGKDRRERQVPQDQDRRDNPVGTESPPSSVGVDEKSEASTPTPKPTGLDTPGDEAADPRSAAEADTVLSRGVSADPGPVPPTGSGSPNPCEQCEAPMSDEHWNLGYVRCEGCDPDGDHVADRYGICRECSRPHKRPCPTCGQPLPEEMP